MATAPIPPTDLPTGSNVPAAFLAAITDNLRDVLINVAAVQSTLVTQAATLATQAATLATQAASNTAMQASLDAQTATLAALTTTLAAQSVAIAALQQITSVATSPLPPANLHLISATTNSLTVGWDPVAVAGAVITYVVESQDATGAWTAMPATAATSATVTSLVDTTAYPVRVHTVAGTLDGPPGSPVTFTTATLISAPVAPTVSLVGTPSTAAISVSWSPIALATSNEVGILIAGVWTSQITTPAATTSATLTGLTANTPYTIQVRGNNGTVHGDLSAGLVVSTAAVVGSAPAQLVGGVASNATSNSIDFAWTAQAGIGTPPATDPGIAAPALTIAPSRTYTFQNIAFANTAQAGNAGTQSINIYCDFGTLTCALAGTTLMRAGASGTNYLGLQGTWPDLLATVDTVAYHSAASPGTATVTIELWVAGSVPPPVTNTIPVTITTGATTAETGGYNLVTGTTYVPSVSGDGGSTWTTLPAQAAANVTFINLAIPSHPYSMRAHAVSQAGVAGIESAITIASTAALGGAGGIIGDATGVQAVRAADFVSSFGSTTYPLNAQDHGTVLTDVAGIGTLFNYITGGTGHRIVASVYCWAGANGPAFTAALQSLINSADVLAAPRVDHFGGSHDPQTAIYVANHLAPGDIAWIEGSNEPDQAQFGVLSAADALSCQQALRAGVPGGIKVISPSVTGPLVTANAAFWGGSLAAMVTASPDGITSHLYPGWGCYSAQNMLRDWTNTSNMSNRPVYITEADAVLYNTLGGTYPTDHIEQIRGYYDLCGWITGYFKYNLRGFVHWSLRDFTGDGFRVPVGLFNDDGTPRLGTIQIAALIKLLSDTGATARNFPAGKIDVTITGMQAGTWQNSGGQCDWVQTSPGDFYGFPRNEQNQFSATTNTWNFRFGSACVLVEDIPITGIDGSQSSKTPAPRSTFTNVPAGAPGINIQMGTEVRVIHVRKAPNFAPLTAIVTLAGSSVALTAAGGADLGNYVDPDGAFTQGNVKVTSAALPSMTVFFRSDIGGTPRDEIVFELGLLGMSGTTSTAVPFNMPAYSVQIVKAGVTLATIAVPKHYWRSRWRWQSAPRPIKSGVTTASLITAGLIPKFNSSAQFGTSPAPPNSTYTPMGLANIAPFMGGTGERPEIGPVTEWQARYLCLASAPDLASTMAQLEASGTIPWHYRDEGTGAPINVNTYPGANAYASSVGTPYLPQDPAGTGITMDTAHTPALAYLPFILTGDPYALEELQFCNCFSMLESPPASRGNFGLIQTRAMAWRLRTLMQLAKVTPASVPGWMLPKSYFQTWLNTERDYLLANFVNSVDPEFTKWNLVIGDLNSIDDWPLPGSTYFAAWEQDFFAMIAGWCVNLGNSDWAPIEAYTMQNLLARTNGTSGWARTRPSGYRLGPLRASGGATFNGAISGTTLTVTTTGNVGWNAGGSGCTGGLAPGQVLISGAAAGTTITAQLTSTEPDAALQKRGTYSVSISQTVALRSMRGDVTPWLADWGAAWTMQRTVFGLTGADPTTLPAGDQTYPSYARCALAVANAAGVAGAAAAETWLHGQLTTLAAADAATNQTRYKYAIAPS